MFYRKISFERIEPTNDKNNISNEELRRIITSYFIENHLLVKTIIINENKCIIKVNCNRQQKEDSVLFMISKYFKYFNKFRF